MYGGYHMFCLKLLRWSVVWGGVKYVRVCVCVFSSFFFNQLTGFLFIGMLCHYAVCQRINIVCTCVVFFANRKFLQETGFVQAVAQKLQHPNHAKTDHQHSVK